MHDVYVYMTYVTLICSILTHCVKSEAAPYRRSPLRALMDINVGSRATALLLALRLELEARDRRSAFGVKGVKGFMCVYRSSALGLFFRPSFRSTPLRLLSVQL